MLRMKSTESLIRAVIHQYNQIFPFLLRKHVLPIYEAHGKTIYTSFGILWTILASVWAEPGLGQFYCVLDALEECEEKSRDELLRQIGSTFSIVQQGQNELITANGVRLIITSRPYESIRARLFPFAIIRLRAESEELHINRDITRYMEDEVPKLAALRRYDKSLQECVRSALITGGDGMFLWVSLMIAILERTPAKVVRNRIKSIPRGIESVYDRILEEIPHESRETAFNLLMWVAVARRPLHLDELEVACTGTWGSDPFIQSHPTEPYSRDDILGDIQLCGPILKVQSDDSVHLVHQTAKEYLIQLSSSPTHVPHIFLEEKDAHAKIALVCLAYLASDPNDELKAFIDKVNPWYSWAWHTGDPWKRLHSALPLMRYAASFWQDHVRQCSFENRQILQALHIALAAESYAHKWPILQRKGSFQRPCRPFAGYTPLHILVHNDLEAVALRHMKSENFFVNAGSTGRISVLQLGAERGYYDIIVKLLSNNTDIKLIQQAGFDTGGVGFTGREPKATRKSAALHLAVRNKHTEVARHLLHHGANVNATEIELEVHGGNGKRGIIIKNKRTALHIAVDNNPQALIRLLIECGADIEAIWEHYAR
ncbi:hypothetical protein LTR84_004283 [Exophiala bonariae]|uniref:Uncharacterized protein n=1 Tax=Exophiala bonariae TaxID=1690606 RepID=A0AAV9N8F3_9EURO|nr:hypothetical protein LTR84_004283 [Exophiala bonariae]